MDDRIDAARQRVDAMVAERFAARTAQREKDMAAVRQKGVLGAAGVDVAVRRALQMTVAEGRAAIADPRPGFAAGDAAARTVGMPEPVEAPANRLEAIIGFNDCDQINFLEHGIRASRSVCRLLVGGQPVGTGFLVGPGLLLTNNHVIQDAAAARDFVAEFDYELDADEVARRSKRFPLDPSAIFVSSTPTDYDFTLTGVQIPTAAQDFGWLPLNLSGDKILRGEPVVIIQHPGGREKQICLFHSEMVDLFEQYIHYSTDTQPGSSGAPLFNRQWQVVGLHHGSSPPDPRQETRQPMSNEGIRASAILAAISASGRLAANTGLARAVTLLNSPVVQDSGRPTSKVAAMPAAAESLGGQLERRQPGMRTHPPEWYAQEDRSGYDPGFLGGNARVPLPGLPRALQDDATALADGSVELKYMHYSVVMCASRRLPYFSAANLDGASAVSIGRKDRDADHPMGGPEGADLEAADVWFYDGRIPVSKQVGGPVYDKTDFDYGHMTRRLDPVWGDARTLRIANDDTFHLSNCVPQHHQLNTGTWERLEAAVYAAASKNDMRITVITGPVLDPRDPVILDVQCPVAFWKIIAYVENGALRAMGFLQWQKDLVAQIQAKLESLAQLVPAERWHVPIADITRLTALDFGPLLDADIKKANPARQPVDDALIEALTPRRIV